MSSKRKQFNHKDNSESILAKILGFGTVIIFALLPLLYFSGRIAASVTSKEYFFIGMVDILIGIWAWLQIVDVRYRLTRKNFFLFDIVFIFLAWMTLTGILGVSPQISFFSTVESGTGLIFLWHAFFFALMISSLVRVQGTRILKKILQANLFASFVLGIATMLTNYAFDIHSAMLNGSIGGAMMGNALLVAAYFVFSIFLSLVLVSLETSKNKRIIYLIAIATLVFGPILFLDASIWERLAPISILLSKPMMIFGHARMAGLAIGLGAVLSFCIWITLSGQKKIISNISKAGIIVIFLVLGLGIWQIATPQTKLHNLFIQEAAERPVDWQVAMVGLKERPVIGWGQENFQIEYLKHLNPAVFDPSNGGEVYAIHPHNASVELLVNGGIPALVLYVIMIGFIVYQITNLYRRKKISASVCALLLGMLFAYVLQNQMIFDSMVSYVLLFSVIGILAGLSDSSDESYSEKEISTKEYFIGISIICILVPTWICLAYLPSHKAVEMQDIANETSDVRVNNYDHLFHSAGATVFTTDPEFYTLTLASSYNAQRGYFYQNIESRATALHEIDELSKNMDSIQNIEQNNYKFILSQLQMLNLEMFLKQSATPDDFIRAKFYFDHAVALSPTNAQVYLAYAETMIDAQNFSSARDLIHKAIDLNTQNGEAWLNLYNFESQYGTPDAARVARNEVEKYPNFSKLLTQSAVVKKELQ